MATLAINDTESSAGHGNTRAQQVEAWDSLCSSADAPVQDAETDTWQKAERASKSLVLLYSKIFGLHGVHWKMKTMVNWWIVDCVWTRSFTSTACVNTILWNMERSQYLVNTNVSVGGHQEVPFTRVLVAFLPSRSYFHCLNCFLTKKQNKKNRNKTNCNTF